MLVVARKMLNREPGVNLEPWAWQNLASQKLMNLELQHHPAYVVVAAAAAAAATASKIPGEAQDLPRIVSRRLRLLAPQQHKL